MVAGGLAMSIWGGFKKRILTLLVGILGLGFAIITFGSAPGLPFFLACVSVSLAGFMVVFSNTPITALLQVTVPVEMQGRVFATLGSLCAVSVPLGLTITGPLSDMVDVSHVYIVIGISCSILGGAAFGLRGLWTLEEQPAVPAMEARVQPGTGSRSRDFEAARLIGTGPAVGVPRTLRPEAAGSAPAAP